MSDYIIWDSEEDEVAIDCNGDSVEYIDGVFYRKDIDCNCCPEGCGGCTEVSTSFDIGGRYDFLSIEKIGNILPTPRKFNLGDGE